LYQHKPKRKVKRRGTWAPTDSRFEKVAENIDAILDAGQVLFLANGYDGTSMDSVAAKAAVAKMTVYRHFKDKETLFVAIVRRECDRVTDSAKSQPASTLEEAEKELREFAHGLMDYIAAPENVALLRVMYGEVGRFPEMGKLFYHSGPAKGLEAVERILSKLVPADELWLRAQAFLHSIQGDTFQRLLFGAIDVNARHRVFDKQIEFSIRMALSGLKPQSSVKKI
jgi:TetR/AcrR family transcriptional regulator, mexJK operon transcriptional repressor